MAARAQKSLATCDFLVSEGADMEAGHAPHAKMLMDNHSCGFVWLVSSLTSLGEAKTNYSKNSRQPGDDNAGCKG